MTGNARQAHLQVCMMMRKRVNFNTNLIGTSDKVLIGTIPANAQIIAALVRVLTVFNAGSSNVLTAGTSSGSDADVVNSTDVDEATTGAYWCTRGQDLTFASDTDIFAKYVQTGGAASTGQADIVILWAPNNDG
jgi:hypothetical protein